jgi:hypothetical protein
MHVGQAASRPKAPGKKKPAEQAPGGGGGGGWAAAVSGREARVPGRSCALIHSWRLMQEAAPPPPPLQPLTVAGCRW